MTLYPHQERPATAS